MSSAAELLDQVEKDALHGIVKRASVMDVAQRLRDLAMLVKETDITTAVVVIGHPDGKVSIYGFGDRTGSLQVGGWLARAQSTMARAGVEAESGFMLEPPAI